MTPVVIFIPDPVFPKAALPNAPFPFSQPAVGKLFFSRNAPAETRLDQTPSGGKIPVAFWQSPYSVNMIGQYHPGIDMKWPVMANGAHCLAQAVDFPDQQIRFPVGDGYGKKPSTSWSAVSSIICHG